MFDFNKIGAVVETLEGGLRDIDSRLQSIENLLLTLIALQAEIAFGESGAVAGIDRARATANAWRQQHTRPPEGTNDG